MNCYYCPEKYRIILKSYPEKCHLIFMYRTIHQYLTSWFTQSNRKPLILRGARQVGKTSSVRILARELGLTLLEANMEDPHSFISLLKNNQPKEIFEIMALEHGLDEIRPDKVLIFFDEVQECPEIISFLRYCFERANEFAVICAGSLLEFTLAEIQTSFPVGRVEYLYMGPMTFEEYLLANSKQGLLDRMRKITLLKDTSTAVHQLLEKEFREYLLCGGMPEAVKVQTEKSGILALEKVKASILDSYRSDFSKYNQYTRLKPNINIIQSIFDRLPFQIGNKIKYSKLVDSARAEQVKKSISFLEKARILTMSYHSAASTPPLKALKNEKWFKLFYLDVGLVQTQFGVSIEAIKTARNLNDVANGILTEQFIAQHLNQLKPAFYNPELYHWGRNNKGSEAEVDFLFEFEGRVYPIEVKSGTSKTMRSLVMLQKEKRFPVAFRFYSGPVKTEIMSLTMENENFKYQLISLPHYLIEQLPKIIKALPPINGNNS